MDTRRKEAIQQEKPSIKAVPKPERSPALSNEDIRLQLGWKLIEMARKRHC